MLFLSRHEATSDGQNKIKIIIGFYLVWVFSFLYFISLREDSVYYRKELLDMSLGLVQNLSYHFLGF